MKGKILVTGGTGYIGSHTVVELLNDGYEVVVIDNLSNSEITSLDGIKKITGKGVNFEKIEMCNQDEMRKLFLDYSGIDAVVHFAALKAVGESVADSGKYYRNNLVSLMNLLDCMIEFKVKNIVFSSSCTVYGQPEIIPVKEFAPIKTPESPYGKTKQICESIIKDYIKSYGNLNCIILRYFNPIGAHPSALIGEQPRGIPNNLIPYLTQTAIGLRDCLKVFGNDYDTPDGSCIRDYINVVDLAESHVKSITRLLDNSMESDTEIFNIGTGKGVSVLELINKFIESTGVNIPYKIVGRRAGDIEKVWADASLAKEKLGWESKKTLEETLVSAWKWQKSLTKN